MTLSAADQRQAVAELTSRATGDLDGLWPRLQDIDPGKLKGVLLEVLPAIFDLYGPAAASLAADWFEDLRADARAKGRVGAVLAKEPVEAQWKGLIGRSIGGAFGPTPRYDDVLTLLSGGLQRAVANQHRLTVVDSTQADPHAKGWRRIGIGENCKFCNMLIDRGAVYHGDTVTFRAHDHCNCVASPTWDDGLVKVSGEPYRQSQNRPKSDAALKKRNQAAYSWMREHE